MTRISQVIAMIARTLSSIGAILVGLLLVGACNEQPRAPQNFDKKSLVTKQNFERIQIGMDRGEVEAILGDDAWYAEAQTWVWKGANGEAIIDFQDGHSRVEGKRWVPNK